MTATVAMLIALSPAAGGATPRASFTDIEDEVMCIVCGVPLNIAESPQADRERVFIRRLIGEGRTKAQIKQELVRQLGPQVLALPEARGFRLAAYLIPILAVMLGVLALSAAGRRWRRVGDDAAQTPPPPLSDEDRARLDTELRSFDR